MSLNNQLNKITKTNPEENREINKKITIAFTVAIVALIAFISFLIAINPNLKKTPAQQPISVEPLAQNEYFTTSSGVKYKIIKKTKMRLGGQIDGDHLLVESNIDKASDWHNQAKEIISELTKKNSVKPTAISLTDQNKTDLLNWNTGNNKTIFYTYPTEVNESELFDIK